MFCFWKTHQVLKQRYFIQYSVYLSFSGRPGTQSLSFFSYDFLFLNIFSYFRTYFHLESTSGGPSIMLPSHRTYTYMNDKLRQYQKVFKMQSKSIYVRLVLFVCLKGQLISEWLFAVLNFPKKQTKKLMNFCPRI